MKKRKKKKNKLRFSRRKSTYEFNLPDYTLDINGIKRISLPTGDNISGICTKRSMPKVQLPEGKTIGIAYNKGNYQVVDAADFKTMGKKI